MRAAAVLLVLLLAGCVSGSHNEAGGYREACEDLPGLIGDDC